MVFLPQSMRLSVSASFFAILVLAMPHHAAAQNVNSANQNNATPVTVQNPVNSAQPNTMSSADQGTTDMSAGDNTVDPNNAGPRPVPKRLSAQERWNRLSPEERSIVINEWLKLDETIRPVFPVFRDNALEAQAHQQGPISPASITPAQPASGTAPTTTLSTAPQESGENIR